MVHAWPHRWLLQLLLGAACCLAAPAPAAAAPGAASRAVWIWEVETYAMLGHPEQADEAIAFMRRHGIDAVYLYADAFRGRNPIANDPTLYHDLVTRLHAGGLRVYALLGSAYLNTENYVLPEHRADAEAMLRRVIDYNRAAPHAARFEGVNLDIEPEALRQWNEHTRDELARHYLDMSAALMAVKRASRTRMTVGPALMLGWDRFELEWRGRRRTAIEHVIDLYDDLTLMDYRSEAEGPDGIIAHAAAAIAYANQVRKPVVIGLETAPHDDTATFQQKSPQFMHGEMDKVLRALGQAPSFGGFALHHYQSWRDWLQRPRP